MFYFPYKSKKGTLVTQQRCMTPFTLCKHGVFYTGIKILNTLTNWEIHYFLIDWSVWRFKL